MAIVQLAFLAHAHAQTETDYYKIATLDTPEGVAFEVGGMALLPDGSLAIAIRRGEIWRLESPYEADNKKLRYTRIAYALHEPLGLLYHEGDLYTTQRSELTRLRDADNDGVIDEYTAITNAWGVTGNYHEYAYGPVVDREGRFWITLNQTLGEAVVPTDNAWRGWGLTVGMDGTLTPMCAGMRSPCGLGANAAGDVFFTDQQGEWVPTNSLHQLRRGAFYGHAVSLAHTEREGAPLSHPGSIPSGIPLPEAAKTIPNFQLPAVWFPYRKTGMSATDIVCDRTAGRFGPFNEQLFVGDFTMAEINRVYLERIGGAYQGAVFNFRRGFQCAIVRMAWGADATLFTGQTNRGWNSAGSVSYGLQRVTWTGDTPFEIAKVNALPDGFRFTFTLAIDPATAKPESFRGTRYTYTYHNRYGSDEMDTQSLVITDAILAEDHKTLDLRVDNLREVYVHELHADGIRSADGLPLLHDSVYYTLNNKPSP